MEDDARSFSSSWIGMHLKTDPGNPVLTLLGELLVDGDLDESVLLKRVRELYEKGSDD